MVKKIFSVALIAAIAVAVGFTIQQEKKNVNLSDMMLNNVEALARSEGGGNNKALAQRSNGDYCCAKLNGNSCTQSPDC